MNDPKDMPIDVAEVRAWMTEHKDVTGKSWKVIAEQSGIKQGTLSAWIYESYQGNAENIARAVIRYRQLLQSQSEQAAAEARAGLAAEPGYLETPTSVRLRTLMRIAHRGAMTLAAMGPGTSKTATAINYSACIANVMMITIRPTKNSVAAMVGDVVRAMGGKAGSGWVRLLSDQVIDHARGRNMLLIVDEANHLETAALEELRAWHDIAGLGICLLGNEELLARIRGGGHARHAFARLNSRIAMSHVQDLPLEDDVAIYLDGWGITSPEQRSMLRRIAMTPGAGGLREIKQIVSHASMLAIEDDVGLQLSHIREAMGTRATSRLRIVN